jgi:hypothetical protein
MDRKEQDEIQKEEDEKKALLDYIRLQNEALKRIYKNTLDQENNH